VLHAVADGRVMFVIPWGEQSVIGTTDTDHQGGPEAPPVVESADVAYLLDTVNHYFPAARLTPRDVTSTYAGLRPLIAPPPGDAVAPSSVSREEEIFATRGGLISIAGGKLTTYRLVSAKVVDRVIGVLRGFDGGRRFGRCRTGEVPLPGGDAPPEAVAEVAISRDGHGLAPAVIGHLASRYGSRLARVLGLVAADSRLGEPIAASLPDPRAEVALAVGEEWAQTLEDVLRRRTQIALREGSEGVDVAGEVAKLMAEPLGWNAEQTHAAVERYTAVVEAARRRWR
jgi:glycerol-3-phosphate dehydrogenase